MKDRIKENARSINVRMILMKIQVQMNEIATATEWTKKKYIHRNILPSLHPCGGAQRHCDCHRNLNDSKVVFDTFKKKTMKNCAKTVFIFIRSLKNFDFFLDET